MKTNLYLVRHAEVETPYHRVFGGRLDVGISDRGAQQADVLARWLRRHTLDAIYASPMRRVQATLAPTLATGRPAPVVVEDLREVDFGDWTGLTWAEVEERFGVSAYDWLQVLERRRFPNGESGAELRLRVERVLKAILQSHAGSAVGIFAHGGVIRMLLALLLEIPLSSAERIEVDYGSVTWIDVGEVKAGRPRTEVQLLNFTPWRDLH